MSDKYDAIYLVSNDGDLNRVRTRYGGQEGAVSILDLACPEHQDIVVVCQHPEYLTLTKSYLLVADMTYDDVRQTIHKFISRVKGRVDGKVWVVKGYFYGDGDVLGVYKLHSAALEAAEDWQNENRDEEDGLEDDQIYATLELADYHE